MENRVRGSARFSSLADPPENGLLQKSLIRHPAIDWPRVLLDTSTNTCSRVKAIL